MGEVERALGPSRAARWLTPGRIAWTGIALGSVSMTCSLLQLSFEPARDERVIAALVLGGTLVWSAIAVVAMQSVLRDDASESPRGRFLRGRAVGRALGIAMVFGWINAATAFLSVELTVADDLGLASCFGTMCAGPTVGSAAGLMFGVAYLWAIWTPERARDVAAFDHPETTLLRVGAWLTASGAVGLLASPAPSTSILQAGVLGIGVVGLLAGARRDLRRIGAIGRILEGRVDATFESLPSSQSDDAAHLAIDVGVAGHARRLVRWETHGDGPFRDLHEARTICLLPDRQSLSGYRAGRLGLAGAALLAAAATLAVVLTSEPPREPRRSLPSHIDQRRHASH
ncbi:MAG: hypothetical protein IT379_35565 [Deltaproteobacteria bacterium]|nr:hypothetical protein [Deltaproteobacteria bacterium]